MRHAVLPKAEGARPSECNGGAQLQSLQPQSLQPLWLFG